MTWAWLLTCHCVALHRQGRRSISPAWCSRISFLGKPEETVDVCSLQYSSSSKISSYFQVQWWQICLSENNLDFHLYVKPCMCNLYAVLLPKWNQSHENLRICWILLCRNCFPALLTKPSPTFQWSQSWHSQSSPYLVALFLFGHRGAQNNTRNITSQFLAWQKASETTYKSIFSWPNSCTFAKKDGVAEQTDLLHLWYFGY